MYAAGLTAVGLARNNNEDAIFYTTKPIGPLPNLFIVADGMGGHNAGEVASQKSLEYCYDFIRNAPVDDCTSPEDALDFLVTATLEANKNVFEYAVSDPALRGMGTTFSACVVLGDTLAMAHIGDSRIYTIGTNGITQITIDHTYVEEMVQSGNLTPDQARAHPRRNQITRVLGFEPDISADGGLFELRDVRSILLCSDGLNNMLTDDTIMRLVNLHAPAEARVQALIDAANSQGGKDNISAIIIDVKGETN